MRSRPVSLRSGLYALALLFAGALQFGFAGLCAIVFLADRRCGSAFGHYDCETPTGNVSKEANPVAGAPASAPRSGPRMLRQRLGASRF